MAKALVSLLAVLWLAAACAPRATPPQATPPAPAVPPAAAVPSPQLSEWDRVVVAAKKEGKLTAYSFHFVGDVGVGLARAFKEKYGIELEIISGPGMQLIERIRSEQRAGQGIGDIITTAASIILVSKKQGMTQSAGELPVFQEPGVWYGDPRLDPDRHVISFATAMFPVMANTQLVKPEQEPTSWLDLLKPEWKGKIALADPTSIPNAVYVYVALTKAKKLDKDYFVSLGKQDLRLVNTTRDHSAAVARGQVALSFGASDSTTAILVKEGAPVKALDMREGIPLTLANALAMLAGAPHPNAARLFINWFLSREAQTIYVNLDPRFSIRKDVPDTRPAGVRLSPKVTLIVTPEDEEETARIMRERELAKLILGK